VGVSSREQSQDYQTGLLGERWRLWCEVNAEDAGERLTGRLDAGNGDAQSWDFPNSLGTMPLWPLSETVRCSA
jgi:hypothetical protein